MELKVYGDSTECQQETWRSGNVTDYAFHVGPGVNETSDEKRNLPPSIIATPNSPCSTASSPFFFFFSWAFPQGLVFGGNRVGRGGRRHVYKDDEFLIFLTFTCPTRDWHELCRFGIVSDPDQPPSRTPDSVYHIRTCSPADPRGPARYLKPPSAGLERMWWYEELPRLNWTLRTNFSSLFYTAEGWIYIYIYFLIASVRYFKGHLVQKCNLEGRVHSWNDLRLMLSFEFNVFVHFCKV